MYTETDTHIISDGRGYSWFFARQRSLETGKRLRVVIEPEEWELDQVMADCW